MRATPARNAPIRTHELGIASHISFSVNALASEKKEVISDGNEKPGSAVVLAGVAVVQLLLAGTFPLRNCRYFPLVNVVQGVKLLPAAFHLATAALALVCGFNS